MGRLRRGSAAAVALMLVAGCGAGGQARESGATDRTRTSVQRSTSPQASTSQPTGGTQSPTASDPIETSPVSTEARDGIRAFDFANATWFVTTPNRSVRLRNAAAVTTASYGDTERYALAKVATRFHDLNGDGYLDAVQAIEYQVGNGWFRESYVWIWTPDQHRAVQVRTPIYVDGRCGNETTSLDLSVGSIRRTYLEGSSRASCAARPTRTATQVIALKGAFLWQTEPGPSALTYCGDNLGTDDGWTGPELNPGKIQVAPDAGAPTLVANEKVGRWSTAMMGDGREYPAPKGWVVVWFVLKNGGTPANSPYLCGYVKKQ